jgi:Golgi phosphoprotein 3
MSTVTRRRVAGQSSNSDDDNSHNSNTESTHNSPMADKKIAYDPRDIDESKSTPKLTLMEEVLLLGLKDKQVIDKETEKSSQVTRVLFY